MRARSETEIAAAIVTAGTDLTTQTPPEVPASNDGGAGTLRAEIREGRVVIAALSSTGRVRWELSTDGHTFNAEGMKIEDQLDQIGGATREVKVRRLARSVLGRLEESRTLAARAPVREVLLSLVPTSGEPVLPARPVGEWIQVDSARQAYDVAQGILTAAQATSLVIRLNESGPARCVRISAANDRISISYPNPSLQDDASGDAVFTLSQNEIRYRSSMGCAPIERIDAAAISELNELMQGWNSGIRTLLEPV
jgi:hypothetical protein